MFVLKWSCVSNSTCRVQCAESLGATSLAAVTADITANNNAAAVTEDNAAFTVFFATGWSTEFPALPVNFRSFPDHASVMSGIVS